MLSLAFSLRVSIACSAFLRIFRSYLRVTLRFFASLGRNHSQFWPEGAPLSRQSPYLECRDVPVIRSAGKPNPFADLTRASTTTTNFGTPPFPTKINKHYEQLAETHNYAAKTAGCKTREYQPVNTLYLRS